MQKQNDRNCARTPQYLFEALNNEYHFDIDAAADRHNKLCASYWSASINALAQDWRRKRPYCNPPYRAPGAPIRLWIAKGMETDVSVFLVPATTSSAWFHFALQYGEVHFFDGRIQFIPPAGVTYSTNDRDSVLVVLGAEARAGTIKRRSAKTGAIIVA